MTGASTQHLDDSSAVEAMGKALTGSESRNSRRASGW